MNFQTLEIDGKTVDEASDGSLRIRIARTGAELVSLARERGGEFVGFLHRDGDLGTPASGWANHATVMGYFLHRLWNQESNYRGHIIRGGNHGFLRHFEFDAPQRLDNGLAYHVPCDRIPPDAYPLRVSLVLSYRIVGGAVRVEFAFRNEEPSETAHVSFGLHPGFAVGSVELANVLFPKGEFVRHLAPGNFLSGETVTVSCGGGPMPFDKAGLPDSYLIDLARVAHREFVVEAPAVGHRIRLDFSEVPFVTLWTDSDDFLCVEPCWGLPDSNPPVPFENKIGIQTIEPGAVLKAGFSLKPEFLT
ncbi:MAG: hypothetical protein SFU53_05960 [Terrimicrobiaceae bacterium]|nr:hypothetical protein [Terrimicrobiaceae bacterium]